MVAPLLAIVEGDSATRTSAVVDYIMTKVMNSQQWAIPLAPGKYVDLPPWLPLHALMILLAGLFLLILFTVGYRRNQRIPKGLTNALEILVVFIRDQVSVAALGPELGRTLAPLFCNFFFFILTLNIMGLIPVFAGATANLSVTVALGLVTLGFMVFGAIYKNGFKGFMRAFMPPGVPAPILVLLVPIEMVGLLIKSMALMIRLFANMLAGAIVLYMIIGLLVIFGLPGLPGLILALMIYLLKIVVAFLQAYIFTMLSAIFIGQTLNPEH